MDWAARIQLRTGADIRYIQCGHEFHKMILLHNLKGAMRLDCSKDMSVHVLICTTYNFSALTLAVWKLWL